MPAAKETKNIEALLDEGTCQNRIHVNSTILESLYLRFADYGKNAYETPHTYAKKDKKVGTFVKLTLLKVIRLYEMVLAQLNPQWNKVMGSPEDFDTYAQALTQNESVKPEEAKYELGYVFLKYSI